MLHKELWDYDIMITLRSCGENIGTLLSMRVSEWLIVFNCCCSSELAKAAPSCSCCRPGCGCRTAGNSRALLCSCVHIGALSPTYHYLQSLQSSLTGVPLLKQKIHDACIKFVRGQGEFCPSRGYSRFLENHYFGPTSYNTVVQGRTGREPAHCQHWPVFVFAVAIKNYHNVNFPSWLDCGASAAPRGVISCVVM